MATDFNKLFDEWSGTYDDTVMGADLEYSEVFADYEEILYAVAEKAEGFVVEFGVGTGNLTKKLLDNGIEVIGYEPSAGMRKIAKEKLPQLRLAEGDFLTFDLPGKKPDSIVSTYAFHHLTDEEKREAISIYSKILNDSGKVIFADTIFINEDAKQEMIKAAQRKNYDRLANDLQTEYYTTIPALKNIFEDFGFEVIFSKKNAFVWLIEATKRGR